MTTLQEVVADLRAECDALDAVLATLDERGWHKETPAVGWDTRDTVGHLADTNDIMFESASGGDRDLMSAVRESQPGLSATNSPDTVDAFTAWQVARVRKLPWNEVYAWWRSSAARLHELLDGLDPKGKYRWGPNMVSPLSLGSARMMETWAHSLDVHNAAGVPYVDTDRLRHIAHLGVRALPYAFTLEGLDAPGAIRVELTSPSGEEWAFGPDDSPTVIRGSAADWCRLVARRDRDGCAGRLRGAGPDAANAIAHGRAFL
jgi:uncharacterized protein (TIGR03084 family)